ncbi:MAG: phosphatidate cytidylyltransferase [Thermotogae bacterium]|uniref:phosphatidate cytidylyltransferase n=1 Tax=Kosmotoga sp. TaxID=1955248 RepID=UPI000F2441F8|nr:phosphatidate cytidylyltransferase [Kosmotoga sp.]MBO8165686.1 phosphatidate cytidylyltransferase [Kosmotoga sp.]MCD6160545.1 phosphatidate cytidylyltransferase [Kosmotoga sp.]RKX49461.1 MAG: phosphatidate cytidylyltransferase [Thermotogota bacterium]
MKNKEVGIRLVTAFLVAPFVVLCFVNYYSLIGLVATVTMFASFEYVNFSLREFKHTVLRLAYVGITTLNTVLYGLLLDKLNLFGDTKRRPELLFSLSFITIITLTILTINDTRKAKLFAVNGTLPLIYVSLCLSFFFPLYIHFGPFIALLNLLSVWVFDAGAYFTGIRFGKIRISPSYSPKKSLEGAIGGYLFTVFFIWLYGLTVNLLNPSFNLIGVGEILLLPMAVAVFGTVGDIAESAFKRFHNVKDSGNILPGHGGMLDRIDGLLFVTPIFYILMILLNS